jgi:DnaJ family protein C protein 28
MPAQGLANCRDSPLIEISATLAARGMRVEGVQAPLLEEIRPAASYLADRQPGPLAIVHGHQAGQGPDRQSVGRGDDLGGTNRPLERTGVDCAWCSARQALRRGPSLSHTLVCQGQVCDAPEALVLPFAGIPCCVAVTDEDDPDHDAVLLGDGNIVTRAQVSVKMENAEGRRDWDSWIDQQIREAEEQGIFNDLPGKGQPLDLTPNPYARDWEIAFKILKDAGHAPEWIELDKAIRHRLEQARTTLARSWEWRVARLGELAGCSDSWSEAERRRVMESWQRAIATFRQETQAINDKIADLNLKVPSARFQRLRVDAASEIARLEDLGT